MNSSAQVTETADTVASWWVKDCSGGKILPILGGEDKM